MNQTFHACFALDQIFVTQAGEIRSCCMAQTALTSGGGDLVSVFECKRANNRAIVERNDASACWAECPARHPVAEAPAIDGIHKIVVDTNTFCPARCTYCSQAYAADAPEWGQPGGLLAGGTPGPTSEEAAALGKWAARNRALHFVPPVQSQTNNQPHLVDTLAGLLASGEAASKLWFEFSGGDSAYHPEFLAALEFLISRQAKVIYLSSGLLPHAAIPTVLEKLGTGLLYVTVSTDAANEETWALIKRKPRKLFDSVMDFLVASSQAQAHNQVAVKFVLMRENVGEAEAFIPFFSQFGIRKFVISEYRAQPVHFVPAPDEAATARACRSLWRSFVDSFLPPETELIVIGLERHFGGRTSIRKAEVLFAGV